MGPVRQNQIQRTVTTTTTRTVLRPFVRDYPGELVPEETLSQDNQCQPAPAVKNQTILFVQSFTAHMPLLTSSSTFRLGRRCQRVLLNGVTCTVSVPQMFSKFSIKNNQGTSRQHSKREDRLTCVYDECLRPPPDHAVSACTNKHKVQGGEKICRRPLWVENGATAWQKWCQFKTLSQSYKEDNCLVVNSLLNKPQCLKLAATLPCETSGNFMTHSGQQTQFF